MALQSAFEFQWNSLLGIATGLFLFYGLFNVLLGISIPSPI